MSEPGGDAPSEPPRPMSKPRTGPRRRVAEAGELEVFVADEQEDQPVDVGRWAELARAVVSDEGIRGDAQIALLFVTDEVISDLNAKFLGESGPTDVLSFPIEEDLGDLQRWPDVTTTGPDRDVPAAEEAPLLLGDVVICPAVAARNAPEHTGTYEDELALLVVHGVLHVLGMDHADPGDAARMRARERELLERYHGAVAAGTDVPVERGSPGDDPTGEAPNRTG